MGGIGSGNYYRWSTRPYTDDYLDLDIRLMNQRGWLNKTGYQNLSWKKNGHETGAIQFLVWTRVQFPEHPYIKLKYKSRTNGGEWQELSYEIALEKTKCNYGGERFWFKCPECNKRVCVLYGGTIFKCRTCHGLVHKSRNETALEQAIRRLNKEKENLWPDNGLCFSDSIDCLDKPKWIRNKTFLDKKIKLKTLENETRYLMYEQFASVL